ncbi:type I polyketide synthase, partial [Streptomyces galbus]
RPPEAPAPARVSADAAAVPWVLSARSPEALRAQALRLRDRVAADAGATAAAVGHALVTTRSLFEHRQVLVGAGRDELLAGLTAVATGSRHPGSVVSGVARPLGGTVFVFPGQGCQWPGMGRELWETSPVFAEQLRACAEALAPWISWSLVDTVCGGPEAADLDRIDVVQPVLFATMVSLARVWRALGVEPDAVIGHSQGEIAAACVAGALSLPDAAGIVAVRARLLATAAQGGGMAGIVATEERVRRLMQPWGQRIAIAAVNGSYSTTVSGEADAVAELVAACTAQGGRARTVPAGVPGHSPLMDRFEPALLDELAPVRPVSSPVAFHSTVTGAALDGARLDAAYWFRNMRETVRFDAGMRSLFAADHGAFIEVSPHPLLMVNIQQMLDETPGAPRVTTGSLRRGQGGFARLYRSAAEVFVAGVPVSWPTARPEPAEDWAELPTYPFQRQRYWLDTPREAAAASPPDHRLPGAVTDPPGEAQSRGAVAGEPADTGKRVESGAHDALYRVDWVPAPSSPHEPGRYAVLGGPDALTASLAGGGPVRSGPAELAASGTGVPPVVFAVVDGAGTDGDTPPAAAGHRLRRVLRWTREWLLDDRFSASRLVVVTREALQDGPAPRTDPAATAVWGFLRSAQTEPPGRFTLLDTDDRAESWARIPAAAATGEEQLRLSAGTVTVPRLTRPAAASRSPVPDRGRPALGSGTVLITGGTSGLGALLARHLVERHGVRRLLLTSRRGTTAPAVDGLRAALTGAGAHVEVAACDVTDRAAVAALIGAVPDEHPLTAVIHCAAVLDDGVVESLTGDRLDTVLAPKTHGAWHLHEATRHLDLSAFVLFSSVASLLGTAGQAGYAAANAFLNGLAETRRAQGLPATALCWGYWAERSELGAALGESDLVRLRRQGVLPMPSPEGLALFDAALARNEAVLVPARLHLPGPGAASTGRTPSPLLRELLTQSAPAGRPEQLEAPGLDVAHLVLSTPAAEAEAVVRDVVRAQTALVLGHEDGERVGATVAFRDLGLDSLTALELRNKLSAVTGLKLPATLAFDHPNAGALARFLIDSATPAAGPGRTPADRLAEEIERLGARLEEEFPALADEDRATLSALVGQVQGRVRAMAGEGPAAGITDRISTASVGELLSLLDRELDETPPRGER